MNKIAKYIYALALCCPLASCSDYLDVSTPENADDEFVTATSSETFKVLSWCYATYRQGPVMSVYRWNDPIGSDAEYYPEIGPLNNANARLQPELLSIGTANNEFSALYSIIARTSKLINLIAEKDGFKQAKEAGEVNDWTQLYGESLSMKAFCYFELVKHYGDVPYGYENTSAAQYSLNSRFDILDNVIDMFKEAAPYMYRLGEGGITAERMYRGFAEAMAGMAALYSAGWQTVRTDVAGLYGDVQLETKGVEEYKSIYARRTDYLDYYKIAETYFDLAMANKGTAPSLLQTSAVMQTTRSSVISSTTTTCKSVPSRYSRSVTCRVDRPARLLRANILMHSDVRQTAVHRLLLRVRRLARCASCLHSIMVNLKRATCAAT